MSTISIKWDKSKSMFIDSYPIQLRNVLSQQDFGDVVGFIQTVWTNGIPKAQEKIYDQDPVMKRGKRIGLIWMGLVIFLILALFVDIFLMTAGFGGGMALFMTKINSSAAGGSFEWCTWCFVVMLLAPILGSLMIFCLIFTCAITCSLGIASGLGNLVLPGMKLKKYRVDTTDAYFNNINENHFRPLGIEWKLDWDTEIRATHTRRGSRIRTVKFPRIDIAVALPVSSVAAQPQPFPPTLQPQPFPPTVQTSFQPPFQSNPQQQPPFAQAQQGQPAVPSFMQQQNQQDKPNSPFQPQYNNTMGQQQFPPAPPQQSGLTTNNPPQNSMQQEMERLRMENERLRQQNYHP